MDIEGIGRLMIECYHRERRRRMFWSEDDEYVLTVESAVGPFSVYLHARGSSPDVVNLRARSLARFSHTERMRLLEWVNRFNDRDQWLTASVRDSHDSSHVRVIGNSRLCVTDDSDLDMVVRFIDLFIASAAALFEGVDAEMKLPSPADLARWFEGSA